MTRDNGTMRLTFWQAYWRLTVAVAKGVLFFIGMAAYGYVAGAFIPTRLWLTVLMLLAAVALALAIGARRMVRDW